jgi:hypothetical protein
MGVVPVDRLCIHPCVLHRATARQNKARPGGLGSELVKTISAAPKALHDRDRRASDAVGMLQ